MKAVLALAITFYPCLGFSDLSDEDPADLCRLLDSYGLVMTEYARVQDEGRPLCFVVEQPKSVSEHGYEFSYRVISHHTYDHPNGLFLEVSGVAAEILGQGPHLQYAEMASVVLAELFSKNTVSEILLAIESISAGFNRHMIVDGLGVQLRARDYSQHFAGITAGFSIRFDISNTCQFHGHEDLRAKCIAKSKVPIGSLFE